MKVMFAERYGYIKPSNALVIEQIPEEIINAIINCLQDLGNYGDYNLLKETVWLFFLNKKRAEFDDYYDCIEQFLEDWKVKWYNKLNLLEFTVGQISRLFTEGTCSLFVQNINSNFERLNYGYRIINNLVTPITSKEEVNSIEEAIGSAKDNIKEHLNGKLFAAYGCSLGGSVVSSSVSACVSSSVSVSVISSVVTASVVSGAVVSSSVKITSPVSAGGSSGGVRRDWHPIQSIASAAAVRMANSLSIDPITLSVCGSGLHQTGRNPGTLRAGHGRNSPNDPGT